MSKETEAEKLFEKARSCLDNYQLDEAIELGNELLSMNFSGGFEILALAFQQQNEFERAIEILETGVEQCPDLWLLWQLLGNMHSYQKNYAEAYSAYERALACPDAWKDSVMLNKAIALSREGDYQASEEALPDLENSNLAIEILSVRLANLNALEEWYKVMQYEPVVGSYVQEVFRQGDGDQINASDLGFVSSILADLAYAYLQHGDAIERAKESARLSLNLNRQCARALQVVREIRNEKSDDAVAFRVIVEGRWPEKMEDDDRELGFFSTYEVVASSTEEALEYIKEIESKDLVATLSLDEAEELAPEPSLTKGVYWRSGYNLFPLEETDDLE
ncbi:MAG: hypothetical protein R3F51_17855 [Cyanobacteriota/Melainabacteria group bacterium]